MRRKQTDYCTYRTIRTLICSWNVDASKPTDLNADAKNADFLSNTLKSVDSPDIIVFGFQELIDLEDKKLTASECHVVNVSFLMFED
jgi:hypothetical protein